MARFARRDLATVTLPPHGGCGSHKLVGRSLRTARPRSQVYLGNRYSGHEQTSEEFSTAGRSIQVWTEEIRALSLSALCGQRRAFRFNAALRPPQTGLCACDIVSKWTWAATLLQSSNVAFKYGISGPFWYAAGATIQVLLFAVLAVEIKRKCPSIHTILEVVGIRWGTAAHLVPLHSQLAACALVCPPVIPTDAECGGLLCRHSPFSCS